MVSAAYVGLEVHKQSTAVCVPEPPHVENIHRKRA
jgi:hypothetical protein